MRLNADMRRIPLRKTEGIDLLLSHVACRLDRTEVWRRKLVLGRIVQHQDLSSALLKIEDSVSISSLVFDATCVALDLLNALALREDLSTKTGPENIDLVPGVRTAIGLGHRYLWRLLLSGAPWCLPAHVCAASHFNQLDRALVRVDSPSSTIEAKVGPRAGPLLLFVVLLNHTIHFA